MPKHENIPPIRKSEIPELLERGLFILNRLGLNIDDLKDKKILDIGSGEAAVENYLKRAGINSIISIDKKLPWMSLDKNINQVNALAEKLPLKDSSIDLIIAHGGPPTTSNYKKYFENYKIQDYEEERVESYLNEFRRVLTENGEARIAPPRLWFIYMKNLHDLYSDKNDLTPSEKFSLDYLTEKQSLNYLQKKYNISLHQNEINDKDDRFNKYWVMKKSYQ